MHLFAYGTLMFPEIWRRVVGKESRSQPASLNGYAAYRGVGDSFPVLISSHADDVTPGVVFFDLDEPTLKRLDEHESKLYDRLSVTAILDDGRPIDCQAYVLPQRRRRRYATNKRWTAEWFKREDLTNYIARHWPPSGD